MTGHHLTADLSGCPADAAAMTDPQAAYTWPERGAVTLDAFVPKYVPRGSHDGP